MQTLPSSASADSFYRAYRKLSTPFDVIGGSLVVAVTAAAGEPVGAPLEAWEHVFLEQGAKRSQIDRLDQLRGKVRIPSPADALAFVRLTTTLATCFLFPVSNHSRPLDVVDGSKLNSYYLYGKKYGFLWDATYPDGFLGILSHKRYRELEIPDAVSRRVSGGFLVERPIVVQDIGKRNSFRVVLLRQNVAGDGSIIESGMIDLGRKAASVDWSFPRFL